MWPIKNRSDHTTKFAGYASIALAMTGLTTLLFERNGARNFFGTWR